MTHIFFNHRLSLSLVCIFFLFFPLAQAAVVQSTKRLVFDQFPGAHNPSLIKAEQGYLLSFRYQPERYLYPWISYIGIVLLDETLTPISSPQLLKTRGPNSPTLSQSEDARFFSYKKRIFLIYNDNIEVTYSTADQRRDMFIAELLCTEGHFHLSSARRLIYETEYASRKCQKNWLAFEYEGMLLLIYSINPHEILYPNFVNGLCHLYAKTQTDTCSWSWGPLRGSCPPLLLDEGEYLAFFHSGIQTRSKASYGYEMWHYFMGAYIFSADPPFQIKKISSFPIIADDFYTPSSYYKRIIYPGGAVLSGSHIHVAYGKDDQEIWIATLDKQALMGSLVSVKTSFSNVD